MHDEEETGRNGDVDLQLGAGAGEPSPGDGAQEPSRASATEEFVLKGGLKQPEVTGGRYIVLWAMKPARGERALFQEVAFVQAHDPAHARRIVLEEDGRSPKPYDERGEVARFLLGKAGEKGSRGILLRAVPAMHWPADVKATTFVRPDPVLDIG